MRACILLGVAAALGAPQDDDIAKRVRALVEQLQSDDLQAADDANAALAAMGPAALPSLRSELEKSAGDARLKIEAAIKRIERREKLDKAMGTPVLVTLKAEGTPLSDILTELARSSGQPIAFKELAAERITLSLEKKPFWEALDAVCKAHGGVMWSASAETIVVEKTPYRACPMVVRGNVALVLSGHTTTKSLPGSDGTFTLEGRLLWTRGSRPMAATIAMKKLEDDKGTSLLDTEEEGDDWTWDTSEASDGAAIGTLVEVYAYILPSDESERMAHCSGAARLSYVLEMKKLLTVKDPAGAKGTTHAAGAVAVTINETSVSGRDVATHLDVTYQGEREASPSATGRFMLVDDTGASHTARIEHHGTSVTHDGKGTRTTDNVVLRWKLPDKRTVAALEMLVPADTEELLLPFDFPGLPLK